MMSLRYTMYVIHVRIVPSGSPCYSPSVYGVQGRPELVQTVFFILAKARNTVNLQQNASRMYI